MFFTRCEQHGCCKCPLCRSNKGPCLRSVKFSLSDHIFILIGIRMNLRVKTKLRQSEVNHYSTLFLALFYNRLMNSVTDHAADKQKDQVNPAR